ncbi:HNH endonuclease [Leucobacter allii]|uniref:HNH endonuclease n=1 Tax=Leucobacter allii TaxID=2932247 RepID=UPI003D26BE3B
MATSRTGTAKYKAWRKATLHRAQQQGITHCPCNANCSHHRGRRCNIWLDYLISRRPNSAEPDHIVAHAQGGRETRDNGTVLCRRCNQAVGDKTAKRPTRPKQTVKTIRFGQHP